MMVFDDVCGGSAFLSGLWTLTKAVCFSQVLKFSSDRVFIFVGL